LVGLGRPTSLIFSRASTGRSSRLFLSWRVTGRLISRLLAPRVLRLTFEDASLRVRLVWPATSEHRPKPVLSAARHASFLSWGSQRPSLHRHTHQVSTPASCMQGASSEGCQLLGLFRPCRFSRLRRLPPPGGRGLVASRYRSWDSPRFRLRSGASPVTAPRYVSSVPGASEQDPCVWRTSPTRVSASDSVPPRSRSRVRRPLPGRPVVA